MKKIILMLIIFFMFINVQARVVECEINDDCGSGYKCYNYKCYKSCTSHSDCGYDEKCNASGRCYQFSCGKNAEISNHDCKCKSGFEKDGNGNCVVSCNGPREYKNASGSCIKCGKNRVANLARNACICDSDSHQVGRECYKDCKATDEIPDGSGDCKKCETGEEANSSNNACVCKKNHIPNPDGPGCIPCKEHEVVVNNTCVCDAGYSKSGGAVCLACEKGTYKSTPDSSDGLSRICLICKGNTYAPNEASTKCDPCPDKTIACVNHDVCSSLEVTSPDISRELLSVGVERAFFIDFKTSCEADDDGVALGTKVAVKGTTTNGSMRFVNSSSLNGFSVKGFITPSEACQDADIKINVFGVTINQTIPVTGPWYSSNVYSSKLPTNFSTATKADENGDYSYVKAQDCSRLSTGGYKCVYNYRGCGSAGSSNKCFCIKTKDGDYEKCSFAKSKPTSNHIAVDAGICNPAKCSHPPGCYADPELERVKWFENPCTGIGKYTVHLKNVKKEDCVNKCDGNLKNVKANVTYNDDNTCKKDISFGPAEFGTVCVNDNKLLVHSDKFKELYSINCTEKLDYSINYTTVYGKNVENGKTSIKSESGIKADVNVENEIKCKGVFNREQYIKGWQVMTGAPDTTTLDNIYFWQAAIEKYKTDALEYVRWIIDKDYVKKAAASDGVKATVGV